MDKQPRRRLSDRDLERLDDLEDAEKERQIQEGIRKGITKWMLTVCVTATSSFLSILYMIGGFIYDNSAACKAAIQAFLSTWGGKGQ